MTAKNSQATDMLVKALAGISSEEDIRAFLDDLCTIKEIQDMAQRFSTAKLLKSGMNYLDISAELGISTTTISRVSRALNYGSGGYDTALKLVSED